MTDLFKFKSNKIEWPANSSVRDKWVADQLKKLENNITLLDVGAGECRYKSLCNHLIYVSHDFTQYDGVGDRQGLQSSTWDTEKVDIKCDILEIPEDRKFDAILCTEVLEHVPDPIRALDKMESLLKPSGRLILTAPFASLTHMAPYFHTTGFSRYFYEYHFDRLNMRVLEITENGGYFSYIVQELLRCPAIAERYLEKNISKRDKATLNSAARIIDRLAKREKNRQSSELLSFGLHVCALKMENRAAV